MHTEENLFRTAVMGGFNREDVTAYLEKIAASHKEELAALQGRIEALESAKHLAETSVADLEGIRDRQAEQITKLTQELDRVKEERDRACKEKEELNRRAEALECERDEQAARAKESADELSSCKAQVTVLAEVQRALAQKSEALAAAEAEVEQLRKEHGPLKEDAEAYRAVKARVAGIELEAHQRAQEAENEACRRADELHRSVEAWLGETAREFHTLRTAIDGAADRTRGELEQIQHFVEAISGRFLDGEEALNSFLHDYKKTVEAPQPLEIDEE